MSWAARRQAAYSLGTLAVLALLIGVPVLYWYSNIPETCNDGIQNNDETAIDKGGSCPLLDERMLSPHAILWSRTFPVRDGTYNVISYIENPNENAGVMQAPYRYKLYDERNILVAEREGSTYLMPGTITPVFEGRIDTGNRKVARAYLEFTAPLVWERMYDVTEPIVVESKDISDITTAPRLVSHIRNSSVIDLKEVQFSAVVFDTAGNAFAGSSTIIPELKGGERQEIVFTWPDRFEYVPGRIDVIPFMKPSFEKP